MLKKEVRRLLIKIYKEKESLAVRSQFELNDVVKMASLAELEKLLREFLKNSPE